jgi:hypothetical protein
MSFSCTGCTAGGAGAVVVGDSGGVVELSAGFFGPGEGAGARGGSVVGVGAGAGPMGRPLTVGPDVAVVGGAVVVGVVLVVVGGRVVVVVGGRVVVVVGGRVVEVVEDVDDVLEGGGWVVAVVDEVVVGAGSLTTTTPDMPAPPGPPWYLQ